VPNNLAGTISRTFAQLDPFRRYPPICGGFYGVGTGSAAPAHPPA